MSYEGYTEYRCECGGTTCADVYGSQPTACLCGRRFTHRREVDQTNNPTFYGEWTPMTAIYTPWGAQPAPTTPTDPDSFCDRVLGQRRDDYADLRRVLDQAYQHAARGKGNDRHANGRHFKDQPMLTITRDVGLGFPLGQAMKKAQEAGGMADRGSYDAAVKECLGAINYLAGAIMRLEEMEAAYISEEAA